MIDPLSLHQVTTKSSKPKFSDKRGVQYGWSLILLVIVKVIGNWAS